MDLGLENKVALVAASSRGLGKAVAWELAREGCAVGICARGRQTLEETAEAIRTDTGARVAAVVCDVTRPQQIDRLVTQVREQLGAIDILVNNAGGPPTGPFTEFTDEDWYAALDLNLMSAVRLSRAALPEMKARGWGRIINITSVMVKEPGQGFVLSTAARAAVTGMAKTISNAYGPHGITVNNVCPGYTLTDRVRNLAAKRAEAEGMTVEEVLADFAAKTPAGRVGQPEELAAMVTFLASTRAAYVNGTTIQVDGGRVGCLL